MTSLYRPLSAQEIVKWVTSAANCCVGSVFTPPTQQFRRVGVGDSAVCIGLYMHLFTLTFQSTEQQPTDIGVGAQSTLREQGICARKYVWRIIKIPEFLWYLLEKNNKMPEFYMIFARKTSEFYLITAGKIYFPELFLGERGTCSLPLSRTPMPTDCVKRRRLVAFTTDDKNYSTDSSTRRIFFRRRRHDSFSTAIATRLISTRKPS